MKRGYDSLSRAQKAYLRKCDRKPLAIQQYHEWKKLFESSPWMQKLCPSFMATMKKRFEPDDRAEILIGRKSRSSSGSRRAPMRR